MDQKIKAFQNEKISAESSKKEQEKAEKDMKQLQNEKDDAEKKYRQ